MPEELKNFHQLIVWQKARAFVLFVYKLSKAFPPGELYGVTSQIRRAVVSITLNIAEGFERYHFKDKVRFYHQARGSAAEVECLFYLTKDLQYITDEQFEIGTASIIEIGKLINGLIRSTYA